MIKKILHGLSIAFCLFLFIIDSHRVVYLRPEIADGVGTISYIICNALCIFGLGFTLYCLIEIKFAKGGITATERWIQWNEEQKKRGKI